MLKLSETLLDPGKEQKMKGKNDKGHNLTERSCIRVEREKQEDGKKKSEKVRRGKVVCGPKSMTAGVKTLGAREKEC